MLLAAGGVNWDTYFDG